MDVEAQHLDAEMEGHGGAQAYLDSLTAGLKEAETVDDEQGESADAEPQPSIAQDSIAAMLEIASNSFE
eukprot:4669686-Pleurochrysis_carterae.AAC.1